MATDSGPRVGPVQVGIILTALITASVHFFLFATERDEGGWLPWGFLAAAVGFVVTVAALYAPIAPFVALRTLTRVGLLALTISTMVGYVLVMGWVFDTLAIADKIDEVLLLVLVVAEAAMQLRM